MEFIFENTNILITIVIFVICVIIGYFADKKLKLDEIIDKKKNGKTKEAENAVSGVSNENLVAQPRVSDNKQFSGEQLNVKNNIF